MRLYNQELIEFMESIPKGLRSAVVQAALAMYRNSGAPALTNVGAAVLRQSLSTSPNNDNTNPLARLKGDF